MVTFPYVNFMALYMWFGSTVNDHPVKSKPAGHKELLAKKRSDLI